MKFSLVAGSIAAAIALVATYGDQGATTSEAPQYRLAVVTRGPMVSTISATGTLKAVVTVDVGTQVSGMIKSLQADFNSEVEAGQVIARIDSAPFEARLSQAEAEVSVARASVSMQEASLEELAAEMDGHRAAETRTQNDLRRKRALLARGSATSSAVDTALANHQQARARVIAGQARMTMQKAQIDLARAQVLQKSAAVQQKQLDLDYTYIRSPVNGVVISRNVDAGQTVASSLQAPVLFRIAQDLSQMQVGISVDEADIGQLKVGQKVFFTVDSFSNQAFEGFVKQIRKASYEISNVVTYTVVAEADNPGLQLLPGMTANVTIVVNEHADVIKVPNTALRLRLRNVSATLPKKSDWVWVMDGSGLPQPVSVVSGISDGNNSEIVGGELKEGQMVITGVVTPASPKSGKWLRFGF